MKKVDASTYVSQNIDTFLNHSDKWESELASKFVLSALVQGVSEISVRCINNYYFVCGNENWISDDGSDMDSCFSIMRPFTELGVNSSRYEIVLSSLASEIYIYDNGDHHQVKGSEKSNGVFEITRGMNWNFVLIYK